MFGDGVVEFQDPESRWFLAGRSVAGYECFQRPASVNSYNEIIYVESFVLCILLDDRMQRDDEFA